MAFSLNKIFAKLKKAGDMDDEIRDALLKKALGFETDEIVEEYVEDEKGIPKLLKRKVTKKFNPPDVSALKVLLEDHKTDDFDNMTDGELMREKERLLKLLQKKEKENENGTM